MRHLLVLALAAALGAAACGDDDNTTPTTPTTPATTTDIFPGTLTQNGGVTHSFVTARSGTVQATLTSVAPDSTLILGFSLGTWNGNACQSVIAKDNAIQAAVLVGTANSAGTLCVRIYDVGNLTEPVTYQIDVVHP